MRLAARSALLTASLALVLVVAALPGTTSASSTLARAAASEREVAALEPIVVPVTLRDLLVG